MALLILQLPDTASAVTAGELAHRLRHVMSKCQAGGPEDRYWALAQTSASQRARRLRRDQAARCSSCSFLTHVQQLAVSLASMACVSLLHMSLQCRRAPRSCHDV